MGASAERLDDGQVVQEIGRVAGIEDGTYAVATRGGTVRAARAVGCLVAPEADDTVLVAVASSGAAWVLSVLDRPDEEAPTEVRVEGDLHLGSSRGHVKVDGAEGVSLRSRGALSLASRLLEVHAIDARAFADRLKLTGTAAEVGVDALRTVASRVEQVAERLSQRIERSYRFIQELDVTRAHQIDMRAQETVHVRSKNTMMASDDLVKVDAGQIHLG